MSVTKIAGSGWMKALGTLAAKLSANKPVSSGSGVARLAQGAGLLPAGSGARTVGLTRGAGLSQVAPSMFPRVSPGAGIVGKDVSQTAKTMLPSSPTGLALRTQPVPVDQINLLEEFAKARPFSGVRPPLPAKNLFSQFFQAKPVRPMDQVDVLAELRNLSRQQQFPSQPIVHTPVPPRQPLWQRALPYGAAAGAGALTGGGGTYAAQQLTRPRTPGEIGAEAARQYQPRK